MTQFFFFLSAAARKFTAKLKKICLNKKQLLLTSFLKKNFREEYQLSSARSAKKMGQLSSGEILRQLSSLSSAKSFGQLSSAQLSFFFQNLQLCPRLMPIALEASPIMSDCLKLLENNYISTKTRDPFLY